MVEEKKNDLFGMAKGFDFSSNLKGKFKTDWVEESVIFEKKAGKQPALPTSSTYLGSNFTFKKAKFFLGFILFIFLIITGRIFYLQVIKGSIYETMALNNRQRIIPIPAERGLIFDRNGLSLVKNIPNFYLAIIPQDLPRTKQERAAVVNRLAELTNQSVADIGKILEEYKDYSYESVVIKENLDYNTALLIQIEAPNLPGIEIQSGSRRLYLSNNSEIDNNSSSTMPFSLAHVLGYEGKLNKEELQNLYQKGYVPADNIGKTGVEKTYEQTLRGIYGQRRIEVDAQNKEHNVLAENAPIPGNHLKLSIDVNLQNKLEEIIKSYLKSSNKSRASGIVMDPNNGEILALVSWPAFNDNQFSGGISQAEYQAYLQNVDSPLFNRAIAGSFPSGSTIKPAIAAIALQDNIITPNTSFLSTGGLKVGQWFFPDWLAGGHGLTNVRKALALSVNTFFYYIGGGYGNFVGLGVEKMMAGLSQFGFGKKLGIDLTAEESGFLPSKEWKLNTLHEQWYVGDTYNLSIGQGNLLVSPLQIASMTATVANGGIVYRPHVVHSTIDSINKQETIKLPEIINKNFIDSKNLDTVRWGMRDCVTLGSCRRLLDLPFAAAGKTGTAQWSSKKDNHAWFTSFAPYDKPEIVVTIMVEEGVEGSTISVPIANDFYKWWWAYRNTIQNTHNPIQ